MARCSLMRPLERAPLARDWVARRDPHAFLSVQWARDHFEGVFKNQAENVNLYLTKSSFIEETIKQNGAVRMRMAVTHALSLLFLPIETDGELARPAPWSDDTAPVRRTQRDILSGIKASLVTSKPLTFEHCIVWARHQFEELFSNSIRQLLYNFPPDATTDSGVPIWSGTKRCPTPLVFNPNNVRCHTASAGKLNARNGELIWQRARPGLYASPRLLCRRST